MEPYSKTGNQFDHLVDMKKNDQGLIKSLQFRRLGDCPVHSSLLEDKCLAQSVKHTLEYGCPVRMHIEHGVVLSLSTAQVAVTHKIDDEDVAYAIRHRGDTEDGIFYVPKESTDCEQIMELLRYSHDMQRPFCFETAFNVVDTTDAAFGRLEYTAVVFLDEDQGRQPV